MKNIYSKVIFTLTIIISTHIPSIGQTNTYSFNSSPFTWTNTANWSRGEIPTSSQDVVISANTTVGNKGIIINQNASCNSLSILSPSGGIPAGECLPGDPFCEPTPAVNSKIIIFLNDGITLNVSNNVIINGMASHNQVLFNFGSSGGTGNNSVFNIEGSLTFNTIENDGIIMSLKGTSLLEIGGDFILTNNRGTLLSTSLSTVKFDGTATQSIRIKDNVNNEITYTNLEITGTNVVLNNTNASTAYIGGNLNILDGGNFNNSSRNISVSGNINVETGGTLTMAGSSSVIIDNSPSGSSTINSTGTIRIGNDNGLFAFSGFDASQLNLSSSAIEFIGSNQNTNFSVISTSPVIPKVIINSSGTVTLNSNVGITDSLIIRSGTFAGSSYTINLGGNFHNEALFNGGTGIVNFMKSGTAVVSGSTAGFNTIIVGASTTLIAPTVLSLTGNLFVNGTFNHNNGTITFTGLNAQQTNGVGHFYNLEINKSGGNVITFAGIDTILNSLRLTSGTAAITGSLVLDLNSGYISKEGTGNFAAGNNLTLFKSQNHSAYTYFSSPVATTLADLTDDGAVKIYTYNQAKSGSKFVNINAGAITQNGIGYAVDYGYTSPLISLTGYYDHSITSVNVPLVHTKPETGASGWHLIGNPYPNTLNWDNVLAQGAHSDSLYRGLYFYNQGAYTAYVAGVPSDAANIPPMQGVMVYLSNRSGASTLNGSIELPRSASGNSTKALYRTAPNTDVLKIAVSNGTNSDATYVRFTENASMKFDGNFDAYKWINGGSTPSIYTSIASNKYSINALPEVTGHLELSLPLQLKSTGEHVLTLSEEYEFKLPYEVILEDKLLNVMHDFFNERSYSFNTTQTNVSDRFVLHFGTMTVTNIIDAKSTSQLSAFAKQGEIVLNCKNIPGKATVSVNSISGQQVYQEANLNLNNKQHIIKTSLTPGLYIINVVSEGVNHSEKVVVQ